MIDGSIFVFCHGFQNDYLLVLHLWYAMTFGNWNIKRFFFRYTQEEIVCKNQKALHERRNKNEEKQLSSWSLFSFIFIGSWWLAFLSTVSIYGVLNENKIKRTKNKQTMIKFKNMYPLVKGTKSCWNFIGSKRQ